MAWRAGDRIGGSAPFPELQNLPISPDGRFGQGILERAIKVRKAALEVVGRDGFPVVRARAATPGNPYADRTTLREIRKVEAD